MSDSNNWQIAADTFLAGRNAKGYYKREVFGNYRITRILNIDGTFSANEKLHYVSSNASEDIIAIRTANGVFFNSSILPLIGRRMAWGNQIRNNAETSIQRYLRSKGIKPIPIYQMRQNGLNDLAIKVIDQGKEETVTVLGEERYDYGTGKHVREPDETRHFTGAMLLETVDKNNKPFQFLFDIDRKEIEHKRFNAFFVQLTKNVKTIAEAYQSLKPKLVIDAERKKLKVKRQGEWFFIPTKFSPETKRKFTREEKLIACLTTWGRDDAFFTEKEWESLQKRREKIRNSTIKEATLRAGQNRPNTVEKGVTINEVTYVKGKVSHTGREHEDLILEGWHIAVPNTSVQSWQLDGKID